MTVGCGSINKAPILLEGILRSTHVDDKEIASNRERLMRGCGAIIGVIMCMVGSAHGANTRSGVISMLYARFATFPPRPRHIHGVILTNGATRSRMVV